MGSNRTNLHCTTHGAALAGELALRIIEVGWLHGLINVGAGPYVDRQFFDDPRVEHAAGCDGVRRIRRDLRPFIYRRDRLGYIEAFIARCMKRDARGRGLRTVRRVLGDVEQRFGLAPPIGAGLLAIHLFREDEERTRRCTR